MTATEQPLPVFDIEEFLAAEQTKDLLRFTTAGSVDDGKSTLIGRLLYDSKNVYEDHLRSIAKSSSKGLSILASGSGQNLDLSLLTDGLRAEREQGITIDVAYRYFATHRRKFIIADTPGHEQYTRNMATGASTADLAIVLIDARNGVQPQSRRHAYIAALLGIPRIAVAVNKMDLVGFREEVFDSIRTEFTDVLARVGARAAWFVPISALTGDNVVNRSQAMPWFEGPSLLEHLETVDIAPGLDAAPFRLPVQRVIRPHQDFRGYAGQIASGSVRPGDAISVWPSGRKTRIKSIESFEGPLTRAFAPMSVVLTIDDETDISRGDLIGAAGQTPVLSRTFDAHAVWMQIQPLDPAKPYILKHATETIPARIVSVLHRVDINSLNDEPASTLALNAIGLLRIEAARPIAFDAYRENRVTGSAILIDPATNATAAALMIVAQAGHSVGPVTPADRTARFGHTAASIFIGDRPRLATLLERRLFDRGANPAIVDQPRAALAAAGVLSIVTGHQSPSLPLTANDEVAVDQAIGWLERNNILVTGHNLADGEGI
jgi:sulfate adenylyltransferase subunit 1